MRRTGWRHYQKPSRIIGVDAGYLAGYVGIPSVAGRLAGVSLEARDALTLDGHVRPADPAATTTASRDAHRRAAFGFGRRAPRCKAAVVLSGYASPLYDDGLYRDWHRAELSAWTGNGIRDGRTKSDKSSGGPAGRPVLGRGRMSAVPDLRPRTTQRTRRCSSAPR